MKELFDKEFVHFLWDDELDGKECFVASEIDDLVRAVNENSGGHKYRVHKSNDPSWPFQAESDCEPSAFAYYDPNYECRLAWSNGKNVQFVLTNSGNAIKTYSNNGSTPEPDWETKEVGYYRLEPETLYVHQDKLSGELYFNDNIHDFIFEGTQEECEQFKAQYRYHFEKWWSTYKDILHKKFGTDFLLDDLKPILEDAYIAAFYNHYNRY